MKGSEATRREPFSLGSQQVFPGRKLEYELPVSKLITGNQVSIPIIIYHGKYEGPVVWLSAAIHGDEIQGVEIIRRVMELIDPRKLKGTILFVPIVNVYGFLNRERYLPDRRDLNRSFPGSPKGSLASQIAYLFMRDIVSNCDFGIDLHTGSDGRSNLPQVRANLENPELRRLAKVFGAPIMLHSKVRDGSLRAAATDLETKVLLYEGGESSRFTEDAIVAAVEGITRLFSELKMIDSIHDDLERPVQECSKSSWLRAKKAGIAQMKTELGDNVVKGQLLGIIHNSIGKKLSSIYAHQDGIIIGRMERPLINQGDALFHIAEVKK